MKDNIYFLTTWHTNRLKIVTASSRSRNHVVILFSLQQSTFCVLDAVWQPAPPRHSDPLQHLLGVLKFNKTLSVNCNLNFLMAKWNAFSLLNISMQFISMWCIFVQMTQCDSTQIVSVQCNYAWCILAQLSYLVKKRAVVNSCVSTSL